MEKHLVPLTQEDLRRAGINWEIKFPPKTIPLAFDPKRTATLLKLGGIRSLTLTPGTYTNFTSIPRFGRIAEAAISAQSPTDSGITTLDPTKLAPLFKNQVWVLSEIPIPPGSIERAVAEKGGLRDPDIWAKEVNNILVSSIRTAGLHNLLRNYPESTAIITQALLSSTGIAGIAIQAIGNFSNFEPFYRYPYLYSIAFLSGATLAISKTLKKIIGERWPEHRLSIIPGVEMERALGLFILSHIWRLVYPSTSDPI